jgi:hypothetical protein
MGDEPTRIKHIAQCRPAIIAGQSCPENQKTDDHVLQEDEPDMNCPECKGETPPESPWLSSANIACSVTPPQRYFLVLCLTVSVFARVERGIKFLVINYYRVHSLAAIVPCHSPCARLAK